MRILVTGATGCIGSRLVPPILEAGHDVRCLVRDPGRLDARSWTPRVDVVTGDVLQPESLVGALEGVDVAYYLIHSMGSGEAGFADRDRRAALNFSTAAAQAGLKRIIYLGGIAPKGGGSSRHLESRLETGNVLREGDVPVTEFRAGAIIGSGSLSFELVRYLTERVPLMTTPRWVYTPTQPIAVDDVIAYLVAALDRTDSTGRIIEIGGRDVMTYGDMIRRYASLRGLRRWIVPVPFLTAKLSSRWVGLITPLNAAIARPLIDGLDSELTADNDTALSLFRVDPMGYERAVRLALARTDVLFGCTLAIPDPTSVTAESERGVRHVDREGLIGQVRSVQVRASASRVFSLLASLGGERGWLHADRLWKLRGLIDAVLGGAGNRKAGSPTGGPSAGDTMDTWRVDTVEPDRLIRLQAALNLPGRAWLQYELWKHDDACCTIRQTSVFEPRGLLGLLYWHAMRPFHGYVFGGMLDALRREVEADHAHYTA